MAGQNSLPRVRRTKKDYHEQLHQIALREGPGAKLPTTRELSKALDIDLRTLNDVLRGLEAQNIVYRKDRSGMYVSPKIHRKTIAVVFHSYLLGANATPFWGILLSNLAEQAVTRRKEAGQDLEFFMTEPSEERQGVLPDHVKKAVRAGAINGVVGVSLTVESVQWLLDEGVPCAAFAGWSKWTVATASERFIQAGLQTLADQGCRRIEYWGLPRHDDGNPKWYEETIRDVEAAYAAIGLEPTQTSIGPADELMADCPIRDGGLLHPHGAYTAIKTLFSDPKRARPDGIFIGDDIMALGVLFGLQELGVRVGEDIKIASHSNRNSLILFGHKKHITVLEYDPSEIAGALLGLLDQAMADPELPETQIGVPWHVGLPDGFK